MDRYGIPIQEGYLVEFKVFAGGISSRELSTTLCAFANSEGGSIYIGVTDSGEIRGLSVTPQLLDQVQNAAREGCSPPIEMRLEEILIAVGSSVLKVSTEKSGQLHTTASGQAYIRIGTQDKRVLGDELLRLAESKSLVSFEDTILEAGLDVLETDELERFAKLRRGTLSESVKFSHRDLLVKVGLAAEKEEFKVRVGAFLLFGKHDEDLLIQRDFTFVRYEAHDTSYTFREDIQLPARRLVDRLLELIRPFNRKSHGIKGVERQESLQYPEEAIREAVLNAFGHRDYRVRGLKNECRLYPDRLEFISVGGLPGPVTVENMAYRHYSRNPKMMHALMALGLVEELGQGITLMKEALKVNGNPEPQFVISADQVKVVFRRKVGAVDPEDVHSVLESYFRGNRAVTRRQLESLLHTGKTTTKKIVQRLLAEGYLERLGAGPSTRYRKRRE